MLKLLTLAVAALSIMLLAPAHAAGADLRLGARLTAPGSPARAQARYEEKPTSRGLQQRFKVEIENAVPGASYDISANGKFMGKVRINSLGRGQLDQRVNGDNPGTSVPSLPRLQPGAVIRAGVLSGSLVRQ